MSGEKDTENGRENAAAACLRDLRRLVQFHGAMGITVYPLREEVRSFLTKAGSAGRQVAMTQGRAGGAGNMPQCPVDTAGNPADLLAALRAEIGLCTRCPLAAEGLGRVPGQGVAGSRLLVVGDWPVAGQEFTPSLLMGPEEDIMLAKMMAAIGLPPEEYCVTNVLKCCPAAGQEVAPAWSQDCVSFLQREIGIVRPAVICAMGEIAARAILGGAEPLLRLRGRFSPYRYQDDPPIPVMPTFHPRFLLANPEMKMAAWKDLQAVQRRLRQDASPRRS